MFLPELSMLQCCVCCGGQRRTRVSAARECPAGVRVCVRLVCVWRVSVSARGCQFMFISP